MFFKISGELDCAPNEMQLQPAAFISGKSVARLLGKHSGCKMQNHLNRTPRSSTRRQNLSTQVALWPKMSSTKVKYASGQRSSACVTSARTFSGDRVRTLASQTSCELQKLQRKGHPRDAMML